MTAQELAAWANLPVCERLLDRLFEIRLAADEIIATIEIERRAEPFGGFDEAVTAIDDATRELMERLASSLADCGHEVPSYPFVARDAEIQRVLTSIASELRRIDSLRGPAHDEALTALEQYAGPYALALFFEIQRLDTALRCICVSP